jgi:hypothetical protein
MSCFRKLTEESAVSDSISGQKSISSYRPIKSCKYIPKEKVAAIQDLQSQKASIVEILRVLS